MIFKVRRRKYSLKEVSCSLTFVNMYTLAGISWWQRLVEWDRTLFIKLNSQWTHPWLDAAFPIFRDAIFWAPLYLFVLVFVILNYGWKGLLWSLGFICAVAITDMIGARVFKVGFERLRPCGDPEFMDQVRLLLHRCSGSYSFVSNHAANHFSIASFAFLTFRGVFKNWMYLAFLWSALIAYAQVYVGVHYPLDVLGGALLGLLTGSLMAWIFTRRVGAIAL